MRYQLQPPIERMKAKGERINFISCSSAFILSKNIGSNLILTADTNKLHYFSSMKVKVISSISDVDLDWLQEVSDVNFGKNSAEISDFKIAEKPSANGYTAIIKLNYKTQQPDKYPKSLFLKFCRQDDRFINNSEYFYYKRDYLGLENAPLPKCYDAGFSDTEGSYHVLLEDLSQTHYSNQEIRPTRHHAAIVAEELAKLHAYRWGNKVSGLDTNTDTSKQIENFIAHVSKGLLPILNKIESDFPQELIKNIEKIFDVHPQMMQERAAKLVGMTLIHGDPNPSNILSPNKPHGKTYIIDRQPFNWSLTYWLGVYDLAYMIIPFWSTADRRNLEKYMLKHYHQSLLKFGVEDYFWENCLEDYKLCIAHGIYTAVEWGTDEKNIVEMRWLWQAQLKRSLEAFADWQGNELLQ